MKEILLPQGKVTLVDDEDYDYLMRWKWHTMENLSGNSYAVRSQINPSTKKKLTIRMHRVIMKVKKGEEVDHRDRDGLNNQRYNLRLCTSTQNNANSKRQKRSTSGYKGVHRYQGGQKWLARIEHNYERIYLGLYSTPEEAARVYDKKAVELFGEFARTNFPQRVARKKCQNISI